MPTKIVTETTGEIMLKVIIADDEPKVNLLLQKIVDWETLGYQIAGTANDGERALQLIEEEKPDVLMTDIRMPGVDGMELIRRAKEKRPDLVFIVVSGYRQFEYAQTALKYGVTDYLLKPVNAEELTQLLIRIREEEEKKKRLDTWTASVDRQLRENEWKKREQLVDNLREYAQENRELNGYESLNQEYGCDFHEGTYQVIIIKPDIPSAEELTQLLIRIREEEEKKRRLDNWTASVDRQLRENEWKKREQLVDNLKEYAQENRELNDPERLNQEYGCDFHEGTYQVIVI